MSGVVALFGAVRGPWGQAAGTTRHPRQERDGKQQDGEATTWGTDGDTGASCVRDQCVWE